MPGGYALRLAELSPGLSREMMAITGTVAFGLCSQIPQLRILYKSDIKIPATGQVAGANAKKA